jgi:hypothetical protein
LLQRLKETVKKKYLLERRKMLEKIQNIYVFRSRIAVLSYGQGAI